MLYRILARYYNTVMKLRKFGEDFILDPQTSDEVAALNVLVRDRHLVEIATAAPLAKRQPLRAPDQTKEQLTL